MGPLPPQIGVLKSLERFDGRNTSMSCSADGLDGGVGGGTARCAADELLPCFLRFSEHVVPLTDASNMACPVIERLSEADAVAACSGGGPMQLGDQAYLLEGVDTGVQSWFLDPAYFQYAHCNCLVVRHQQALGLQHSALRAACCTCSSASPAACTSAPA